MLTTARYGYVTLYTYIVHAQTFYIVRWVINSNHLPSLYIYVSV